MRKNENFKKHTSLASLFYARRSGSSLQNSVERIRFLWYNAIVRFMYIGNWKCIHLFRAGTHANCKE